MKRLSHGSFPSDDGAAPAQPADHSNEDEVVPCADRSKFDYLFRKLQVDPENLLSDVIESTGASMAETLIELGNSMHPEREGELPANPARDSDIPSVYTYFGQFITHEVVFERSGKKRKLGDDTVPLTPQEIQDLTNGRTALLDLDSVYGPILQDDDHCFKVPTIETQDHKDPMDLGFAMGCPFGSDLKRQQNDPLRTAIIGDGRNDANRITSQMHLAFLRAHNKFIELDFTFEDAQRALRQHFQWLVIYDYLPRVVGNTVLKSALDGTLNIFNPPEREPFVPVEFSAGAFRFGHSMTRNRYNYNHTYDQQRLTDFFLPQKGGYPPFNKDWIIDWTRFLPGGQNVARRINTRLAQPLFDRLINDKGERLIDTKGKFISLAALDLLRGYSLRLPTGQAVAKALKITPIPATVIESIAGQVSQKQKDILHDSGLSSRTPLWFYVLAEAAALEDGLRLGPVGSSIVASVLVGLVRCSKDSILREPQLSKWKPSLGDGHFGIADLFKFAGVLVTQ
jgi:hypothetical protein